MASLEPRERWERKEMMGILVARGPVVRMAWRGLRASLGP